MSEVEVKHKHVYRGALFLKRPEPVYIPQIKRKYVIVTSGARQPMVVKGSGQKCSSTSGPIIHHFPRGKDGIHPHPLLNFSRY